jgi:hypothetical protein
MPVLETLKPAFTLILTLWMSWILSYRDLSGNQFVGGFVPQIQEWVYLQSFKLARNQFNGSIPGDAFVNMTQLDTL